MSIDQFQLTGRVALVTGGSRNLGKAMALALAQAGSDLLICSRTSSEVEAAREEIAATTGRRVIALTVDITDRSQVEDMVGRALREFGRIDILINNAGRGMRKPLVDMTDADWAEIIEVCLTAPFLCTRAVVPHMLERKYGRIINISSALGAIALPDRSAYCAAKGGLIQLTKVMALEWAQSGITVNAIAPGPFDTPYNQVLKQDPAVYEAYLQRIPQHRWAQCEEIGGTAVYLASEAASFVTGTVVFVDGGWTAH